MKALPKCRPVILQTWHFLSGWIRSETRYPPNTTSVLSQ